MLRLWISLAGTCETGDLDAYCEEGWGFGRKWPLRLGIPTTIHYVTLGIDDMSKVLWRRMIIVVWWMNAWALMLVTGGFVSKSREISNIIQNCTTLVLGCTPVTQLALTGEHYLLPGRNKRLGDALPRRPLCARADRIRWPPSMLHTNSTEEGN